MERGVRDQKGGLGTFTCGSFGTSCRSVGRTGRCLIDGMVGLGKVIAAEDVLVGWLCRSVGGQAWVSSRIG